MPLSRDELEMLAAGVRLDPRHSAWFDTEMPSMNQNRCRFSTVLLGTDKVMAIGGSDGRRTLANVEVHQIGSQKWEFLPSLNQAREGHAAAFVENKVYVFGGYNGNYLDTIECFDLAKKNSQWKLLETKLTCIRFGCSAAVVGTHVYIIGGGSFMSLYLSSVDVFDTATETICLGPNMKSERQGCAAGVVGTTVYTVGGYDGHTSLDTIECLNVASDKSWKLCQAKLLTSRCWMALVAWKSCLLIVGGSSAPREGWLSAVEAFDSKLDVCFGLPDMNVPRGKTPGAIASGDDMIRTIGGFDGENALHSMEVIKLQETNPEEQLLAVVELKRQIAGQQVVKLDKELNEAILQISELKEQYQCTSEELSGVRSLQSTLGRLQNVKGMSDVIKTMMISEEEAESQIKEIELEQERNESELTRLLLKREKLSAQRNEYVALDLGIDSRAQLEYTTHCIESWLDARRQHQNEQIISEAKKRLLWLKSLSMLEQFRPLDDLEAEKWALSRTIRAGATGENPKLISRLDYLEDQIKHETHAATKYQKCDARARKLVKESMAGLEADIEETLLTMVESEEEYQRLAEEMSRLKSLQISFGKLRASKAVKDMIKKIMISAEEAETQLKELELRQNMNESKLSRLLLQREKIRDRGIQDGPGMDSRTNVGHDSKQIWAEQVQPLSSPGDPEAQERTHVIPETLAEADCQPTSAETATVDRQDHFRGTCNSDYTDDDILNSIREKEAESRKVSSKRHDIFLSFHGGDELFDGAYCMRQVARNLKAGVLQRLWEGRFGRKGELSIFFDDHSLARRADGAIDNAIRDGLLQTRGGGIVAILATKGYFKREWCLSEFLMAVKLASDKCSAQSRPNICVVAIGMTVGEIKSLNFIREHGECLLDRVVCQHVDLLNLCKIKSHPINELEIEIADLLLRRGNQILAGENEEYSCLLMKSAVGANLRSGNLDRFTLPHIESILDGVTDPDRLVNQMKLHLDSTHPSRVFVDTFERKWRAAWCTARNWIDEREELASIQQVARLYLSKAEGELQCTRNSPHAQNHEKQSLPDLLKSDSSSSDGSGGFIVSVSLARLCSEEKTTWNDALLQEETKHSIKLHLAKLSKYGETMDDTFITVDSINGRAIATLECDINFDEMEQKVRRVVQKTINSFERLLTEDVGIPEASVREILYVSFNQGSLQVFLHADSDTLGRLYAKLVESKLRLPLYPPEHGTHLVALAPAYFVTMPCFISVPIQENQSSPDAWLWKQHGMTLFCPTSDEVRSHLVFGGVSAKEIARDEAWLSLPTINAIPETKTLCPLSSPRAGDSGSVGDKLRLQNQDLAKALRSAGDAFFDIDDYDRAIDMYGQAANLDQGVPLHWFNLVACYEKKNDFTLMIQAARKGLNADHTLKEGYNHLAIAQKAFGDYTGCIQTIDAGLLLYPDNDALGRLKDEIAAFLDQTTRELLRGTFRTQNSLESSSNNESKLIVSTSQGAVVIGEPIVDRTVVTGENADEVGETRLHQKLLPAEAVASEEYEKEDDDSEYSSNDIETKLVVSTSQGAVVIGQPMSQGRDPEVDTQIIDTSENVNDIVARTVATDEIPEPVAEMQLHQEVIDSEGIVADECDEAVE